MNYKLNINEKIVNEKHIFKICFLIISIENWFYVLFINFHL